MTRTSDELQKYFISILNHDLKTPVLAQMRSLNLLLDGTFGNLTPQQADIVRLTKESCETIIDMVSTTLTNYKFENNEIMINYEPVNIQKIVEQCCIELDYCFKQKNLKVIINPAKHNIVHGDKLYLKKAVYNIIANSITYAHKNTDFHIKITNTELNICISVINKGCPLSENMLNCMFDYYACNSSKNTKIGFGIKLYLALQIVKAHLGGIVVRNASADEVIFDIILPNRNHDFSAIEFNGNENFNKDIILRDSSYIA